MELQPVNRDCIRSKILVHVEKFAKGRGGFSSLPGLLFSGLLSLLRGTTPAYPFADVAKIAISQNFKGGKSLF